MTTWLANWLNPKWVWRRSQQNRSRWAHIVAITVMLTCSFIAYDLSPKPQSCASAATPRPLSDFCYAMHVTITNNTGSALTNQVIAFTINANTMEAQGFMGDKAWDIRATDEALAAVGLMTQDITSTSARWWLRAPSIASGATEVYHLYTGSAAAQRDNPFVLNGNALTRIVAAHQAAFNVTDNLRVNVIAETDAAHASAVWLLSHFNTSTNQGYRLGVIDVAGQRKIRAQVDAQTLDVDWTGALTEIGMTFQNPTLTIYFDEVSQGSSNTGLGSIGTNTEQLILGASFNGMLYVGEVINNIAVTPTRVVRYGLHGPEVTQTGAVNPTYTGTVQDETANNYDGTYTITSSQTNIEVTVSNVFYNFEDASGNITGRFFSNVLGDSVGSGALNPAGTGTGFPGGGVINTFADDYGMSRQTMWVLTATIISIFAMYMIAGITMSAGLGMAAPSVIFLFVGFVGPISMWVTILYSFAAVGLYQFTGMRR